MEYDFHNFTIHVHRMKSRLVGSASVGKEQDATSAKNLLKFMQMTMCCIQTLKMNEGRAYVLRKAK